MDIVAFRWESVKTVRRSEGIVDAARQTADLVAAAHAAARAGGLQRHHPRARRGRSSPAPSRPAPGDPADQRERGEVPPRPRAARSPPRPSRSPTQATVDGRRCTSTTSRTSSCCTRAPTPASVRSMFDAVALDYDANVAATSAAATGRIDTACCWRPNSARSAARTARTPPACAPTRRGRRVRRGDRRRRAGRRGRQLARDVRAHRAAGLRPDRAAARGRAGAAGAARLVGGRRRRAAPAPSARASTKINVGTLLNVRYTAAVRTYLAADQAVTDPRTYLTPARAGHGRGGGRTIAAIG